MADTTEKIPLSTRMFDKLFSTSASKKRLDANAAAYAKQFGLDASTVDDIRQRMTAHPLSWSTPVAEGSEDMLHPLLDTGTVLWDNVKANKGKAIGTGILGASNIAGLVDNDKLLGQAIGTGLGAGAGMLLRPVTGFGPLGVANTAMAGGLVGSLFDTLSAAREKKQREAEMYQQQYYGS